MIRRFMIAAVSAAVIALSSAAFAQQTAGTADEAKAMLTKAVAEVFAFPCR
jgi:predicted outer membrane protein